MSSLILESSRRRSCCSTLSFLAVCSRSSAAACNSLVFSTSAATSSYVRTGVDVKDTAQSAIQLRIISRKLLILLISLFLLCLGDTRCCFLILDFVRGVTQLPTKIMWSILHTYVPKIPGYGKDHPIFRYISMNIFTISLYKQFYWNARTSL